VTRKKKKKKKKIKGAASCQAIEGPGSSRQPRRPLLRSAPGHAAGLFQLPSESSSAQQLDHGQFSAGTGHRGRDTAVQAWSSSRLFLARRRPVVPPVPAACGQPQRHSSCFTQRVAARRSPVALLAEHWSCRSVLSQVARRCRSTGGPTIDTNAGTQAAVSHLGRRGVTPSGLLAITLGLVLTPTRAPLSKPRRPRGVTRCPAFWFDEERGRRIDGAQVGSLLPAHRPARGRGAAATRLAAINLQTVRRAGRPFAAVFRVGSATACRPAFWSTRQCVTLATSSAMCIRSLTTRSALYPGDESPPPGRPISTCLIQLAGPAVLRRARWRRGGRGEEGGGGGGKKLVSTRLRGAPEHVLGVRHTGRRARPLAARSSAAESRGFVYARQPPADEAAPACWLTLPEWEGKRR